MEMSLQRLSRQGKLEMWQGRITDCRASGMTVTAWCKENQVNPKTYYRWQRILFEMAVNQAGPEFVQMPQESRIAGRAAAVVKKNGLEIQILNGAEEDTLRAIFEALHPC